MTNSHLVILRKPYLDAILAGRKTIELRLTKTKRSPFGKIAPGNKLFFKITSGPVSATARVKKIKQFDNLTPSRIDKLKLSYNAQILGTDKYWQQKSDSKYAVLVWFDKIKTIPPIQINKKDWRAWVVLTPKKNFGLG